MFWKAPGNWIIGITLVAHWMLDPFHWYICVSGISAVTKPWSSGWPGLDPGAWHVEALHQTLVLFRRIPTLAVRVHVSLLCFLSLLLPPRIVECSTWSNVSKSHFSMSPERTAQPWERKRSGLCVLVKSGCIWAQYPMSCLTESARRPSNDIWR